ncbi:riboflavin synthase subunit alpha [Oleiphilus messinensis]|uniref:Riboflavin synthase n=1 Tax=Oleiphilus messinensis TaxID=141451 RepID=A0A1Y0IC33_9GAMM|nr:riboflavin synthase subunit alpha [Oleiphilus messinensis]ARU57025.1 riboflavin synthase subunit alpha [Oleiphilus messinensis]
MFTGIIQGQATVDKITVKPGLNTIHFTFPQGALNNVQTGASIAINGTCLTVVDFDANTAAFDVMTESLRLTNLNELAPGTKVNFERAAKFGDEIGGHLLSGHIHTTATVVEIIDSKEEFTVVFSIDETWTQYIMPKGFISINGASLTVGETVSENQFRVHLIPETLRITNFKALTPGSRVNIEIDHQTQTIVNTVKRLKL